MTDNRPLTLLAGAFYVLVTLVAPSTYANASSGPMRNRAEVSRASFGAVRLVYDLSFASPERAEIDRLEKLVRDAEVDPARGLEFMDAFDELSALYGRTHRLQELAWLESTFGDAQKAANLERSIKMRLLSEAIVHRHPLAKGVDLVTLSSGLRGVFRSFDRVAVRQTANGLDSHGALYDSRKFDVITYEISRAIGLNLVPVTAMRAEGERDGHLGVIQAYIADAEHGDVDLTVEAYPDEALWVIDFLTRQMDRHGGNYGVRPGGYVVAWDNNAIFDSAVAMDLRQRYLDADRAWPTSFTMPTKLSEGMLKKLEVFHRKLIDDPDLIRHLGYPNSMDLFQRVETLLNPPTVCGDLLGLRTDLPGAVDQPARRR